MQDIAKALNISRNSVSRALSGKSGISEDTRKLVIETAKKLGYDYKERKPATEQKVQSIRSVAWDYMYCGASKIKSSDPGGRNFTNASFWQFCEPE